MTGTECSKTPSATLVFACSGAADVGAVADQAARTLARAGKGRMFCTVGLGGKVEPILETTRAASTILAIDGCPLDCAKRCLAEAGFDECLHLRVTDLGMTKGETAVSDANVSRVVERAAALMKQATNKPDARDGLQPRVIRSVRLSSPPARRPRDNIIHGLSFLLPSLIFMPVLPHSPLLFRSHPKLLPWASLSLCKRLLLRLDLVVGRPLVIPACPPRQQQHETKQC